MRAAIALLAVALAGAGCAGVSTLQTARSLDEGQTRYSLGPEVSGGGPRTGAKGATPEVGFAIHRGVGRGVQLTGKASWTPLGEFMSLYGAEAGAKLELYRGDRLEVAAAAGGGYRLIETQSAVFEAVHASVPIIVGFNVGAASQIVVAPKVTVQRWYGSGARPVTVPAAGASIGFSWRVSDGLTLFPEVSWMSTPVDVAGRGEESSLINAAIAFVWGY